MYGNTLKDAHQGAGHAKTEHKDGAVLENAAELDDGEDAVLEQDDGEFDRGHGEDVEELEGVKVFEEESDGIRVSSEEGEDVFAESMLEADEVDDIGTPGEDQGHYDGVVVPLSAVSACGVAAEDRTDRWSLPRDSLLPSILKVVARSQLWWAKQST